MEEDIEEMIDDCLNAKALNAKVDVSPFTKWEDDFIDSVAEQYEEDGFLSKPQIETLTGIWEKL